MPDVSWKPKQNEISLSEIIITGKDIIHAVDNISPDCVIAGIYTEYADQLIYPIKKILQASYKK